MLLAQPKCILFCLTLGLCFFSCSSTNRLTMSVAQPAPVYLSPEIKSIGIIDRSIPSEKTKTLDKIEKILSAETKNLDQKGAGASIQGLQAELMASQRFSSVKIISAPDLKQTGMGVFPAAISREKLKEIAEANDVDAIFSLAFYDSDTRVNYRVIPTSISNPLGGNLPAIEHQATVNTLIKNGWRVYDIQQQLLLDEFIVNESFVLNGRGINPMKAVEAIMERDDVVVDISSQIGHQYALRTLPYYSRVSRNYYVRGTKKFKQAKRRAQTGNWDGAAELWQQEVRHRKRKITGRACYNMAIINEINGDLDSAIDWASKAYADYKNKKALSYLKILRSRRALSKQMVAEQY